MVDDPSGTRHALHAVAELVVAGAQYAACERISLRAVPGGFGTRFEPDLRVEGTRLVGAFDPVEIDGLSPRQIAERAGVPLRALDDVYADGALYGPDEVLHVDGDTADALAQAWNDGHVAMLRVAPGCEPILWPEHFDVGITVDEINLGVSPGDSFLDVPYAYVGPWSVPTDDPFFDAPFGAARPLSELDGAGGVEGIVAFFTEGLERARKQAGKAPGKKL